MLHPIWTNRVNETIATDFAGPFPITDRKNKYIMVITDLYGKVLAVHAMPNKETITAARVLVDEWFCRYGIPDRILSDKGKEYTSQLWDALCEMLDVERLTTTPGHPEGDGQAEKAVQQAKKMIRAHVDADQTNWDLGLAQLAYAYNTTVHETIGLTPFQVMFGRKPKIPIDLMYPKEDLSLNVERQSGEQQVEQDSIELGNVDVLAEEPSMQGVAENVKKHVENLRKSLEEKYTILEKNKISKIERAELDYNRRIKLFGYKIGDWVLCNHPKLKRGLARG